MQETEVKKTVSVLDDNGTPINFGWAKSPFFEFDSSLLRSRPFNISYSDRYILVSRNNIVVLELMDDGYLGEMKAELLFLNNNKHITFSNKVPFSLGSFELPNENDSRSIKIQHKKNMFNFAAREGGIRIIKLDISNMARNLPGIRGQIVLSPPDEAESLFTHMPWKGRRKSFIYSRCSPWFSAEGVIQYGTKEIVFSSGEGWGILDWNRGVRPRNDLRFWASGSGKYNNRQTSFCVGFNSADSSYGTENAFFIDGKMHKLNQVSFHIPSERNAQWRFTSNDMRLEMFFNPLQELDENHRLLFYSLKRRQFFGYFSGRIILEDDEEFHFDKILGMTERKKNRL